jgi:hypothetical protein
MRHNFQVLQPKNRMFSSPAHPKGLALGPNL